MAIIGGIPHFQTYPYFATQININLWGSQIVPICSNWFHPQVGQFEKLCPGEVHSPVTRSIYSPRFQVVRAFAGALSSLAPTFHTNYRTARATARLIQFQGWKMLWFTSIYINLLPVVLVSPLPSFAYKECEDFLWFLKILCLEVLGTTWHRQQRLGQAAGLASRAFGRVPNRGGLGQSTILGGRQSSDPAAGTLQGAHRGRGGAPGWAMTGCRKWREKGAPKYWKPLKASESVWKRLKASESVWKHSGLHFQNHILRIVRSSGRTVSTPPHSLHDTTATSELLLPRRWSPRPKAE